MYVYVAVAVKGVVNSDISVDGTRADITIYDDLELMGPIYDLRPSVQSVLEKRYRHTSFKFTILYESPYYEKSIYLSAKDVPDSEHPSIAYQEITIALRNCGLETITSIEIALDPEDLQGIEKFSTKYLLLQNAIDKNVVVLHVSIPYATRRQ